MMTYHIYHDGLLWLGLLLLAVDDTNGFTGRGS